MFFRARFAILSILEKRRIKMEFRIETLEEIKIIGYAIETTNAFMKGMRDCPKFWKEIVKEGKIEKLLLYMTTKPLGIIGASVYNIDSIDQKKFKYFIGLQQIMKHRMQWISMLYLL